jgi:hypothetical protein
MTIATCVIVSAQEYCVIRHRQRMQNIRYQSAACH